MPEDRACRSTVTEKTEPPSRRSQYAFVEALTTAAVDGNISSFLSILCGYTRFPFVILICGHLAAILIAVLYGKTGILLLAEHLNFTSTEGIGILISMVIQGIGYCISELLHHKSTRALRKTSRNNNTINLAILTKNILSIIGASLLQISTTHSFVIDFAYGALYAAIISTLQDVVYTTPLLKRCVTIFMSALTNACSFLKQKIQGKPLVQCGLYAILIYLGFLSSNIYAAHLAPAGIPTYIIVFASTLGLLEQTLVYEYAYRATYYIYRLFTSKYVFVELSSTINYHFLKYFTKNLNKPTLFS
jgi:hypothetical protein